MKNIISLMKNIISFLFEFFLMLLLIIFLLVGVLYYVGNNVIIKKFEDAYNLIMEDIKRDIESNDLSLEYDKFKCHLKFLNVECKSDKIKIDDLEIINNVIVSNVFFKTSESVYTSKVNILNGYNSLFSSSKSPLDLRVIMFSKLIPDEKKMESKINLSINNQDLSFVSDFDVQEEDDIFSKGNFFAILFSKEYKNFITSYKILDIKDFLKKSTGSLSVKNLVDDLYLDNLNLDYEISGNKLNFITNFSLGNEKDEFYIKDLKCTYNSGMKNGIYSVKNDCKSKSNIVDVYLNFDVLYKDIRARNGRKINSVYDLLENVYELTDTDYFALNNLNISFYTDNLINTITNMVNKYSKENHITSQEILDSIDSMNELLSISLSNKDLNEEEREFAKDIQRFLLDINAYSKGIEILIKNKSKDKFYSKDIENIDEMLNDFDYKVEVK